MEIIQKMRLHKYMAKCGVASRRKSEAIILEGRVTLNGQAVTDLSMAYAPGDQVRVDGQLIALEEKMVYIMFHKPKDCVTTSDDQFGRTTVLDYMKDIPERLYPVGRLDYQTSGLLLLTNDGDLSYKITHPSSHMDKVYHAKIKEVPNDENINALKAGLVIDGYQTSQAEFKILKTSPEVWVEIKIHEGRNRQVRKMLEQIGHPVMALRRVAIGNLELGNLKYAAYRSLTLDEINYLKNYEVKND